MLEMDLKMRICAMIRPGVPATSVPAAVAAAVTGCQFCSSVLRSRLAYMMPREVLLGTAAVPAYVCAGTAFRGVHHDNINRPVAKYKLAWLGRDQCSNPSQKMYVPDKVNAPLAHWFPVSGGRTRPYRTIHIIRG